MKIFFFYTEAVSDKIISPYNDKHFTISNFSKLLVLADTNRVLYWVSVVHFEGTVYQLFLAGCRPNEEIHIEYSTSNWTLLLVTHYIVPREF